MDGNIESTVIEGVQQNIEDLTTEEDPNKEQFEISAKLILTDKQVFILII